MYEKCYINFQISSPILKLDLLLQLPEFECDPVDNCLSSVLGQEVELTDEFKRNYEKWLNNEVHYDHDS